METATMEQNYICYCFKHTKEALEEDAKAHGISTIMEQIIAHSKNGRCNCKTNNPKGR
jgi:hypothetical protein